MKTVTVEEKVWLALHELKKRHKFKNLSQVIEFLIKFYLSKK